MIYRCTYFKLQELVCPDVYNQYGEAAWGFFDETLLRTIDLLHDRLGRAMIGNNWHTGGTQQESGLRCLKCSQNQAAIKGGYMYMSAHTRGQAFDFHVVGMLPEETRQWIINNQNILPYPIRLEEGVNWVHLDMMKNDLGKKVITFKP